jgi:cytoskeletal protein CcmA (bactofilin family)
MFNNKKPNGSHGPAAATLISPGTVINGNVTAESDLRIDGTIHGNVSCSAKIVIGPEGYVRGNIEGVQADITGQVEGDITIEELVQLREQGKIQGNIKAGTLQIDPTAEFNGTCQMKASSPVFLANGAEEAVPAL